MDDGVKVALQPHPSSPDNAERVSFICRSTLFVVLQLFSVCFSVKINEFKYRYDALT